MPLDNSDKLAYKKTKTLKETEEKKISWHYPVQSIEFDNLLENTLGLLLEIKTLKQGKYPNTVPR